MLLGMALIVPLVVKAVSSVAGAVNSEEQETPAEFVEELDKGPHLIFQRTDQAAEPISPDDVVISDSDGDELATRSVFSTQTITKGSAVYTGVVAFDVPEAGTYDIEVNGEEQAFLVGPSIGQTFRNLGGVFLLALLGGLLSFIGFLMLIIGIIRRSRAKKTAGMPAGTAAPVVSGSPAPGWYPEPSGAAGQRYWDGAQWTEHTSP